MKAAQMTDEQVLAAFNEFMAANPRASRSQVLKALGTSLARLQRIGAKVPQKMSLSESSRLALKNNPFRNFSL